MSRVGSHLLAAKILVEAGMRGMSSKELASAVIQSNEPLNIIELTGKKGDIIFLHPLLLHARSTNLATIDESNVRFMCHPSIPLKRTLNFNQPFHQMSLLEKSMVCGAMNIHDTTYQLNPSDVDLMIQLHSRYHSSNLTNTQDTSDILTTSRADSNIQTSCDNTDEIDTKNVIVSDTLDVSDSSANYMDSFPTRLKQAIDSTVRTLSAITPEACHTFQSRKKKRQYHVNSDDDNDNYSINNGGNEASNDSDGDSSRSMLNQLPCSFI